MGFRERTHNIRTKDAMAAMAPVIGFSFPPERQLVGREERAAVHLKAKWHKANLRRIARSLSAGSARKRHLLEEVLGVR